MRQLPPLAAVRAFEAAARHQNFTSAANELNMTQAAVSYQVKLLEERVGTTLFKRERGRVLLTEAGRAVADDVTRAFDLIDGGFGRLRRDLGATLTISTTMTFANTWLAWQLGSFQLANPELAVRLEADATLVDFANSNADVAIRSGHGDWPGLHADLLLRVEFTPMCSPGFLERHGGRLNPADLLNVPLIGADDPWWPYWLGEAGVNVAPGDIRAGVRLDSQASEGHAAMAGQGVAMLTPFFWRNDMAEGRLVQLFDQVSTRGFGYWLVVLEARRHLPKVRRFRDWLLATIASETRND
ncbi:MAG TPA: LysR substrate-binding domain-containing protein [Sphingomonas sp.]|nr:LysR substrate-binding domain-containing protein [Sphingomonas sp.]